MAGNINKMLPELYSILVPGIVPAGCNIIKKRHDQLREQGDLVFPTDITVWRTFLDESPRSDQTELEVNQEELVARSQDWTMPIQLVVKEKSSCRIYFNRTECMRRYFESRNRKDITRNCSQNGPAGNEMKNLNDYRRTIAIRSLERLLSVQTRTDKVVDGDSLKIGCCFDVQTKKPFSLTYQEYLSKRSTDMQLIAQHKYGLRVQNEKYLRDLVGTLGYSAVIMDLLEARTSGPVFLASKSNHGSNASSKGASFVLYNSARIETLFRTFEERVASGYYPKEPEEIDWKLLKEEDEWKLFYSFIVEYEDVKERTIRGKEIQIHNLCAFLYKLVGQFSVYYRRTKILTENRPNFLSVLFARMSLLRELRRILNELLFILGISPVQKM